MIRILKYGEVAEQDIFARAVSAVNVEDTVAAILRDVRENGDEALLRYTEKFDGVRPEPLQVTPAEIDEAVASVDARFLEVLEKAAANIRRFHEKQVRTTFMINEDNGVITGQTGTDGGRYLMPDERITREQAAAILMRCMAEAAVMQ